VRYRKTARLLIGADAEVAFDLPCFVTECERFAVTFGDAQLAACAREWVVWEWLAAKIDTPATDNQAASHQAHLYCDWQGKQGAQPSAWRGKLLGCAEIAPGQTRN
jgi:hypothetical protein